MSRQWNNKLGLRLLLWALAVNICLSLLVTGIELYSSTARPDATLRQIAPVIFLSNMAKTCLASLAFLFIFRHLTGKSPKVEQSPQTSSPKTQTVENKKQLDAPEQHTDGIAHDLNNLLATIQYAIQLTRTDDISKRSDRVLQTALSAVARGGELTEQMLSISKRDAAMQMILPHGNLEEAVKQPKTKLPARKGTGQKILVTEDESNLLIVMEELLEELGFEFIPAQSGQDALSIIKSSKKVDLLLTDVVMPKGIGGFELAKQVKRIRPDLPVVYMSGYTGFTASEMGEIVAPVIHKPCSPTELADVITRTLNSAREPVSLSN